MPVKVYKLDASPPARAAMMACEIFGVPVELVDVDILKKEHLAPDYLKKNPLHSVPVLEDGNLTIADSHAILMYIADAYGKNDSMYPKDLKQRALVNQKLFFETAILFPKLRQITYTAIVEGDRNPSQKKLEEIDEAYGFMEEYLVTSKYLAGDHITIADVSAITTVTSLVHIVPLDAKKYPKTVAWVKDMEKQPYCKKLNAPGAAAIGELVKNYIDL